MHEGLRHQVAAGVVDELESLGILTRQEGDFPFLDRFFHVVKMVALLIAKGFVFLRGIDDFRDVEAVFPFFDGEG